MQKRCPERRPDSLVRTREPCHLRAKRDERIKSAVAGAQSGLCDGARRR
jgi:hypothetical protein